VRAPFDGVVADRLLDVGAAASPATPIFNLVTRGVELHLAVDEARVAQVRPGQAAELAVSAYPERTFAGTVSVVAPLGDARTHTFDVRVLADDAAGQLRPGMLAEVRLVTEEQAGLLLIPNNAIVTQGQGTVVFTVRDGKAALRKVRTGATDGKVTAILDGVSVGDQVVVGQGSLRDGQSVSVRTPAATATPTATPARGQ
jgi:membrane fusion protein (multidrug efflux system)